MIDGFGVLLQFTSLVSDWTCTFYCSYWFIILGLFLISPLTVLLPQFLKGKLDLLNGYEAPPVWVVAGKKYDFRPFVDIHPGGKWMLNAARGSDCTGLIESYHPFLDREVLYRMMLKYEVEDDAIKIEEVDGTVYSDPLYEDLKLMLREHFRGKGRGSRKMPWSYLVLNVTFWCFRWYLILLLVFRESLWTIPVIGVLSWFLTGNVMHDASHCALLSNPMLNQIFTHAAFPYGVNTRGWHIQHVMSHHIHTNEENDVDLHHFEPVMILEKGRGSVNVILHAIRLTLLLSTAMLHLAVVVPYGLIFGQVDPANGHRMYDHMPSIRAHRSVMKKSLIVEFACVVVFFIVCGYHHGFIKGVAIQMCNFLVVSYLFCLFTQVTHLQEDCFPSKEEMSKMSFAKRQIATSLDFATDSPFWGFVSGGLNAQAVHHLFPTVSSVHLRHLYPKFLQVCQKHGVEPKVANSFSSFIWGFISFAN